jgi:hypothetical protein
MSVLRPAPCCFDYCRFELKFEENRNEFSKFLFLRLFYLFWIPWISYEVLSQLRNVYKEDTWNFVCIILNYTHQVCWPVWGVLPFFFCDTEFELRAGLTHARQVLFLLLEPLPSIAIGFSFFFFFLMGGSTGAWTQGLHLEPLPQPFFVMSFFEVGGSWTICLGWLPASWVARIIGVSHQHPASIVTLLLSSLLVQEDGLSIYLRLSFLSTVFCRF